MLKLKYRSDYYTLNRCDPIGHCISKYYLIDI